MATGKPIVFDTSVYVAALRAGLESEPARQTRTHESRRLVRSSLPRTHLAAVVAAELQAGARDAEAGRAIAALVRAAQRVGRLVTPGFASWLRAGEVIAAIRQREPRHASKLSKLWNDLLIALSATQIGATVVTGNRDDFELARRHISFDLVVVQDKDGTGGGTD